jgi:hypothetical protein
MWRARSVMEVDPGLEDAGWLRRRYRPLPFERRRGDSLATSGIARV